MAALIPKSLQPDTDYESDDKTSGLGSFVGSLVGAAGPSVRSYDIIARNCGGSAGDIERTAKIRRVRKGCRTYEGIALYVQNSQANLSISIRNLYKINRENERKPFDPKIYRMLLWHGTSVGSVPGIIKTGFRMGSGGLYGGGIYFADRIAKSAGYCGKNSANVGYFFLAEVDLGKVYKAHHVHTSYTSAPAGFNSVKGNGSQIPTWRQNRSYHGAVLPCGVTCQNTRHAQFDLPWNEYIVYDPNRIIVRFLVECTF